MPPEYESIRSALDALEQSQRLHYRSLSDELEQTKRAYAFANPLDEITQRATESLMPTLADASRLAQIAHGPDLPVLRQEIPVVAHGLLPSDSAFDSMRSSVQNMLERDRALSGLAERTAAHVVGRDFQLALSGTALSAMQGMTAYSAFEERIGQLKLAASALEPLQRLSASLAETLGASASLQNVRDTLGDYMVSDFETSWGRDYQLLAALAASAMYGELEHEGDPEPNDESADAVALENERHDVPQEDARLVTIHFAVSWFAPSVRLQRLARRIDPLVADDAWDRQILLIAQQFPEHAATLTRLGCSLLQRLAWPAAQTGARANGAAECLTNDDAEEFAHLADAMSGLLVEIEESIS